MKIFSFRKIYALHFLSKVDYVRSSDIPLRSETIYSLPRSSLKRSLTHVRLRHRSDITGMNQKFYQTSPGFRMKFQGNIFFTLWVSNPFTQDPCNFDKKNTLRATSCEKSRKKILRKRIPPYIAFFCITSLFTYTEFWIFTWSLLDLTVIRVNALIALF